MNNVLTWRTIFPLFLALAVWLPGRFAVADTLPQIHPKPGDAALFHAAMDEGRVAAKAQQWSEAHASFLRAWEMAPDRPDVLFLLGVVESHLPGHQWQAIDWWRAFLALQHNPKSSACSLAQQQIAATEDSAHQQALALLEQLNKLSSMLPQASDQAAAKAKIQADAAYVQMLWRWRKAAHGVPKMGLAAAWCWGLTAVNAHLPPDGVTAQPAWLISVRKPSPAWQVFYRRQRVFTRWIKHVGRSQRIIGESHIHHRFVMYWALRFYLKHTQADLNAGRNHRAWAMAQNILTLQPTAYDMTRAVQTSHVYADSLYKQTLPENSWYGSQAVAALYLPVNVGISFTEIYNRRDRLKVLTGHWNLAIHDYRRVLGIYGALANPNFPYDAATARRLMRCQSYEYVRMGRALFHLRRYRRAGAAYAQARIVFPGNSAAIHGLKRVQNRLAQVANLAAISLKIHSGNRSADLLAARAQLRFHLGDLDGALADCQAAIILNATLWLPRLTRMKIEMQQGQYLKAIADGTGLLALHYANPRAIYLLRAECRRRAGHWAKAATDYQQVLHDDSHNISALAGHMTCALQMRQYHVASLDAAAVISAHAPGAAYALAVSALKTSAWADSKAALVYLGRLYAWGKVSRPNYLPIWSAPLAGPPPIRPGGVPINYEIAFKSFRKAAVEGSGAAMAGMGALCYEGLAPKGQNGDNAAMLWFHRAAKTGYADAMVAIGWLYANGAGVVRNDATALSWFRRAAAAGSGRGMDAVGEFYHQGRGVAVSATKALAWYHRAADAGCRQAFSEIGSCYANGWGVAKDLGQAVQWYKRGAASDSASGMYALAQCYKYGYGVNKNAEKAREWETLASAPNYVQGCVTLGLTSGEGEAGTAASIYWLKKAAALGDTRAMCDLAQSVSDDVEAVAWYRRAAHLGSSRAMRYLAMAYYKAVGVSLDYARARTWWLRAAGHGDAHAQRWLGIMFASGQAKPFQFRADYLRAKRCWELAAKEGSSGAKYDLYLFYHYGWGGEDNGFLAAKWLARTGELSAVYKLAVRYQDGRGTAKNPPKAIALLQQASQGRWPAAMNLLAVDYMSGYGVKQDITRALKWFHKAAEYGSPDAMCWLGHIYERGQIVTRNYTKAMKWYKKAAKYGSATGDNDVGFMYAWGEGVPSDYLTALKYWRQGAAKGSKVSMAWIAHCYKHGLGVAKDPIKALVWRSRLGDHSAENSLGYDYYEGQGVPQNYELAAKWFIKAADGGDVQADDNLGYYYLHHGPFSIAMANCDAAVISFQHAARKGNVDAMLRLGDCYCYSRIDGVTISHFYYNPTKGIALYRKAAAAGSALAALNLGYLYIKGNRVPEDDQKAVQWFRKAAAGGSKMAMTWMAWCYQNGRGVPQDHSKAMQWQNKAQATPVK